MNELSRCSKVNMLPQVLVVLFLVTSLSECRLSVTSSTPSGTIMPSGEVYSLSCTTNKAWFLCIWEGPGGLACQCQTQAGGVSRMCLADTRIHLSGGRNTCSMTISDVSMKDIGQYRCVFADRNSSNINTHMVAMTMDIEVGIATKLSWVTTSGNGETLIEERREVAMIQADHTQEMICKASHGYPVPELIIKGPGNITMSNRVEKNSPSGPAMDVFQRVIYQGSGVDNIDLVTCSSIQRDRFGGVLYTSSINTSLKILPVPWVDEPEFPFINLIAIVIPAILIVLLCTAIFIYFLCCNKCRSSSKAGAASSKAGAMSSGALSSKVGSSSAKAGALTVTSKKQAKSILKGGSSGIVVTNMGNNGWRSDESTAFLTNTDATKRDSYDFSKSRNNAEFKSIRNKNSNFHQNIVGGKRQETNLDGFQSSTHHQNSGITNSENLNALGDNKLNSKFSNNQQSTDFITNTTISESERLNTPERGRINPNVSLSNNQQMDEYNTNASMSESERLNILGKGRINSNIRDNQNSNYLKTNNAISESEKYLQMLEKDKLTSNTNIIQNSNIQGNSSAIGSSERYNYNAGKTRESSKFTGFDNNNSSVNSSHASNVTTNNMENINTSKYSDTIINNIKHSEFTESENMYRKNNGLGTKNNIRVPEIRIDGPNANTNKLDVKSQYSEINKFEKANSMYRLIEIEETLNTREMTTTELLRRKRYNINRSKMSLDDEDEDQFMLDKYRLDAHQYKLNDCGTIERKGKTYSAIIQEHLTHSPSVATLTKEVEVETIRQTSDKFSKSTQIISNIR